MKYFEHKELNCAKCLDGLVATLSEDRKFITYEHVKWYEASYCEDIGKSFKLPVVEVIGEVKDAPIS